MTRLVLLGVSELRRRLGGVSRQRVDQLSRRRSFPSPCADLAQGRVWLGEDVEAWIGAHRPAPDEEDSDGDSR